MKACILIAITLCLFGCNQDVSPAADNTVHLAGVLATSTGRVVASYWKDGVYSGLSLTNDSTYSGVSSLYVDGSLVLIGGWKWSANPPSPVVIWQNGNETVIDGAFGSPALIASRNNNLFGVWFEASTGWVFNKNGITQPIIDTAYNIGPTALALLGDDMYISGCSSYHDWTSPDSPSYQHAQYWKNGQLIFRESELSNALSIFIHQNDIYMAGHLYTPEQSFGIACYWKNGQRVDLTDENVIAVARSVFVTDKHVYVAGMIDDQAVYWKDGDAIALTTSGTHSMANSIVVQGTDVHVAGYEHGHPAYWKNDVKQDISNQNKFGQINFLVVGSN